MAIKSIPRADMPRYTNALDDMRTLERRAASTNPVWIAKSAERAANAIEELLKLVASLEESEANLVAQLKARPFKSK